MIQSLRCGIGNESIKCIRGNQNRMTNTHEKAAFQNNHIQLVAAKQDDTAFQVFIKADEDFILAVTNATIFHPQIEWPVVRMEIVSGQKDAFDYKTSIEGFIEDDDRCMKADLLLHDDFITVPGRLCQPVWVDIKIPADTCTDCINGEVIFYSHRLFDDEQVVGRLSFTIDVVNVMMPKPRDFHFYLNLWQHPSNISRTHSVPLWSDEHFTVLEPYLQSMAEIGQKVITLIVSEVPWAGQYCFDIKSHLSNLFEYSIIPVEKDEYGGLILDFSFADRYVQTCISMGIDKEIEVIGLVNIWCRDGTGFEALAADYPDAIRIRYYDRKDKNYKYFHEGKDIIEYIHLLEAHFKEMGWLDLVRIMADEPADVDQYRASLNAVKKTAPDFKFKAAINHTSFIEKFRNDITDFVMITGSLLQEWETYSQMKSDGDGRYLWYTCCGISPDSCIRAPLLESRFIGWLTAYLGLEGFLRWNYTVWPENPTQSIYWNAPIFPAGENCFVYPGSNGRPILSMRYMHLRRGIRDFELLEMLRRNYPDQKRALESAFMKIIKTSDVTKSNLGDFKECKVDMSTVFSLEYEEYETSKKELLKELETLGKQPIP